MSHDSPVVYLVDDDPMVLKALTGLLRSAGHDVRAYASARAFLDEHDPATPGCVVLDFAMPELDGLALQAALASLHPPRRVLFLTGRGTIPTSVQAMKAGAIDFLTKPVEDEVLQAAVRQAIEHDRLARTADAGRQTALRRVAELTPRERQILERIVAGQPNKQIAADLAIAQRTVKFHRVHIMEKTGATSLADLVRIASSAGVLQPASPMESRPPVAPALHFRAGAPHPRTCP